MLWVLASAASTATPSRFRERNPIAASFVLWRTSESQDSTVRGLRSRLTPTMMLCTHLAHHQKILPITLSSCFSALSWADVCASWWMLTDLDGWKGSPSSRLYCRHGLPKRISLRALEYVYHTRKRTQECSSVIRAPPPVRLNPLRRRRVSETTCMVAVMIHGQSKLTSRASTGSSWVQYLLASSRMSASSLPLRCLRRSST